MRLLCDARGKFREAFMHKMVDLSQVQITVACHLAYENSDYNGMSLQWLNSKLGRAGSIVAGRRYSGKSMSLLASVDYEQILETTVEQLYRTSPIYAYRAHNIHHIQDYLDYFHIIVDAAASIIDERKITHALFYCVPHLFYDTVFYQVAKAMGAKITVLRWSQFPGRFFSMNDIADLGKFDPEGITADPYPIEQGSVPDLFYMEDKWQQEGQTGKISKKAVFNLFKHLIRHDPLKLFNPIGIKADISRISGLYAKLPDWRDPFAKFFHTNELAYFETIAQFEDKKIDLSQKYIYVPLHNQPEMSTSALGGQFRDQALVIETLARKLPEGWKIFVKENPRQSASARGPMFYHRLARIPSVEVMPSNANTHALSQNAQFVASVTGTVGWEAIRLGRPAMVFGAAWYGSLPGVVRYSDALDFEKVAQIKIDHAQLQADTGALVSKSHAGIIEQLFFPLTPDLDHDNNTADVASTALKLLRQEVSPTFG